LNNKWILGALGVVAVLSVAPSAQAQRKSGAENSLIGIKLYDSGLRVVSIYGTPDRIEGVGGGGGAIGPGGGGPGGPGGAPGGSGGPMAPQRSGEGGGPGAAGSAWHNDLSNLGDTIFQKGGMAPSGPTGPGGGGQQMGAAAPGAAGPAGPGGPGGGGVGPGGGSGGRVIFTRWIYNRNGSKYGFVLDKANRVVQIEALGLQNAKVRTARGIGFGSTFAQLIKKYNTPDGYEISGDNVVVRFLVRNKVAFRLSRLGPNKPQVVTGIVVAAGKN
jgi:hypothetical protein